MVGVVLYVTRPALEIFTSFRSAYILSSNFEIEYCLSESYKLTKVFVLMPNSDAICKNYEITVVFFPSGSNLLSTSAEKYCYR